MDKMSWGEALNYAESVTGSIGCLVVREDETPAYILAQTAGFDTYYWEFGDGIGCPATHYHFTLDE